MLENMLEGSLKNLNRSHKTAACGFAKRFDTDWFAVFQCPLENMLENMPENMPKNMPENNRGGIFEGKSTLWGKISEGPAAGFDLSQSLMELGEHPITDGPGDRPSAFASLKRRRTAKINPFRRW